MSSSNVTSSSVDDSSSARRPPPATKTTTMKRRSRAARRVHTTVLTTDVRNFRQMVQEFTGFPTAPYSSHPLNLLPNGGFRPSTTAPNPKPSTANAVNIQFPAGDPGVLISSQNQNPQNYFNNIYSFNFNTNLCNQNVPPTWD